MDPAGNSIAAWMHQEGPFTDIVVNRYQAGTGWSVSQHLPMVNRFSTDPRVAMDRFGNAIVVWANADDASFTRYSIYAARFVAGSGWGVPELLENDDVDTAYLPQISMMPDGEAMVIWVQDGVSQSSGSVRAVRYVVGSGWTSPVRIDLPATTFPKDYPRIAVSSNGTAVALWQQHTAGNNPNLVSSRYTPAGGWSAEALVENDDTGFVVNPSLAMDDSGNAFAVWTQAVSGRNNVYANRLPGSGSWGTPVELDTNVNDNSDDPRIAVDAQGTAIAVWDQYQAVGHTGVYSSRLVAGGAWSPAESMESQVASDAGRPDVGVDANGNAVAVWVQSDGSTYEVMSNTFD